MINTTTIDGRLASDPTLRFISSGKAVVNIRIGHTPRTFDRNANEWRDGETLWIDASLWGKPAERVAENIRQGDLVLVSGELKQRSYEKDGQTRTVTEIAASEIALIQSKAARNNGGGFSQPASAPVSNDPWASGPALTDEPPF